jgi:hypothetical protein
MRSRSLAVLAFIGASSPTQVLLLAGFAYAIVQTITFSLYLYSSETLFHAGVLYVQAARTYRP